MNSPEVDMCMELAFIIFKEHVEGKYPCRDP